MCTCVTNMDRGEYTSCTLIGRGMSRKDKLEGLDPKYRVLVPRMPSYV